MALAEGVLLEIGTEIAKAVLRLWVRSSAPGALSPQSDINELLGAAFPNLLQRRRVGRQFDQLAERIASKLEPFVEVEFAGLPDNERIAAAVAVAETLAASQLTFGSLVADDLEVDRIEERLRVHSVAPTRGLGEGASELYDLLLHETSSYIVDLAASLPGFDAVALREILHRESTLIEGMQHVLDVMPTLIGLSGDESIRFEHDYRRAIARELDHLQLFGVTLSEATKRYALSVAYIALTVSTETITAPATETSQTKGKEQVQTGVSGSSRDIDDDDDVSVLPVDVALARSDRTFVRGEAGSGKTTLLQWLGVMAGTQRFDREGPLGAWNEAIPLFLRLRQYVDAPLPGPERFLDQAVPNLVGKMPQGWVHDQLERGRALVLIDGVDELPETQREAAQKWVTDLVEAFPAARYVVTSRPAAVSEHWLGAASFEPTELQPMTIPDISAFIDHWYDAAARGLGADDLRELEGGRGTLKMLIRDTPSLRNIATTPLLCALLCALNRDRRGQIPRDRVELYRIALEMLLERRDVERHVGADDVALLLPQKEAILRHFAYWLVVNGRSSSEKERFVENIGEKLRLMQVRSDANDVARYLLIRSGVIREPVAGTVDFIHRTFQEYFAADEAVHDDHVGVLVDHAHLDQWREVVILAIGRASRRQREEILRGLLTRGDAEAANRHRLHLLAVACLETAYELDPVVRQEVEFRLEDLVPPRNMTEARAVASAGEVAVPLLALHLHERVQVAAASIRALSLIGGDTALGALTTAARDPRITVVRELARAWQGFDPKRFAEEVLADSPLDSGSIVLRDPDLLEGLPYLKNLRSLTCRFRRQDDWSLFDVVMRPELTALFIDGSDAVSDLAPLAELHELRFLHIPYCDRVTSIEPLVDLRFIENLGLSGCSGISDFGPIARLASLRHLSVDWTELTDVLVLGDLPELRSLALNGTKIRSASGFEKFDKLEHLNLTGCRQLTEIGAIAGLSLQRLYLMNATDLNRFDAIGTLQSLQHLDLDGCPHLANIGFLEGLEELRSLDLRNCSNLVDIGTLRAVSRLKSLHIEGTLVTDLSPLFDAHGMEIWIDGSFNREELPREFLDSNAVRQAWGTQSLLRELWSERGVSTRDETDVLVDLDENESLGAGAEFGSRPVE